VSAQSRAPTGKSPKSAGDPNRSAISLDPLVGKNLRLQGTFSHTWGTWERVLTLMGAGKLTLAPMRRAFPLEAWREAFHAMEQRRTVKSVLIPD
jgi:L-iditol 2-dehydrogenase